MLRGRGRTNHQSVGDFWLLVERNAKARPAFVLLDVPGPITDRITLEAPA
jgi:hypothetical protein